MRLLSAVWTFTRAGAPEIGPNPVEILRELKAWVRLERRKTACRRTSSRPGSPPCASSRPRRPATTRSARVYFQALVLSRPPPGRARAPRCRRRPQSARLHRRRDEEPLGSHAANVGLPLRALRRLAAEGERRMGVPWRGPEGHIVEPKKLVAKVREASASPGRRRTAGARSFRSPSRSTSRPTRSNACSITRWRTT
jgi:hypothetical protein